MISRRLFLGGLLASAAAPAIVRASSLMPIKAPKVWVPPAWDKFFWPDARAKLGDTLIMRTYIPYQRALNDAVLYGTGIVLVQDVQLDAMHIPARELFPRP